ncbi:MAG: hypothetical protein P8Y97_01630 [Candidatus Lokiarchaeota archaeon]
MVQENSIYEDSIAKILDRSIILFRQVGYQNLADKWDKILKNYRKSKAKNISKSF